MGEKSIKKNIIMSTLLTVSNCVFPLLTYSYVARVLGPIGTGKVAFVTSVLQYFGYIATLGIPAYGLRECAKVRNDKEKLSGLVYELFVINLCATIVAYILLFIGVAFYPKFYEYRYLFAVQSITIILTSIGFEWLYQSLEEYEYITKRSLLFKTISVALTFLLIRNSEDYLWYGFVTVFASAANYICNFLNVRKYISFKGQVSEKHDFKKHLKPIFVLFSASVMITIYSNFDVVMIGILDSEKAVGLYNAALKIKNLVLALSTAVTSVLIPRITFYIKNKKESKVVTLLEKSLRITLVLAIPLSIFIMFNVKPLLLFFCGREYLDASNTLVILSVCIIVLCITNIFGNQILIPHENENRYSQSIFVGLWINLILNFLLIPSLGAFGAAIGTLITEVWNAIWMGIGCKKYIAELLRRIKAYNYFFAIAVACVVEIFTGQLLSVNNIFFYLATQTIVFFGLYYIILWILKDPIINEGYNAVREKTSSFLRFCNKRGK